MRIHCIINLHTKCEGTRSGEGNVSKVLRQFSMRIYFVQKLVSHSNWLSWDFWFNLLLHGLVFSVKRENSLAFPSRSRKSFFSFPLQKIGSRLETKNKKFLFVASLFSVLTVITPQHQEINNINEQRQHQGA